MLEIGMIKYFSPLNDGEVSFLASFLSPSRLGKINNQKNKEESDRKLIAWALAVSMIKKHFGIPIEEQEFADGEYGKPHLIGFPDVHFNISHSGKYIMCVVSDIPVGVDVEEIRQFNPKVAKKAFSKEVQKRLSESENKDRDFTREWVKLEANLKRLGVGLAKGFQYENSEIKIVEVEDAVIAISV